MNGRGVFRLRDAIGHGDVQCGLPDGRWVRAIPEHFDCFRMRLTAAWEVICGRAIAMEWPKPGELEDALAKKGRRP